MTQIKCYCGEHDEDLGLTCCPAHGHRSRPGHSDHCPEQEKELALTTKSRKKAGPLQSAEERDLTVTLGSDLTGGGRLVLAPLTTKGHYRIGIILRTSSGEETETSIAIDSKSAPGLLEAIQETFLK